MSSPLSVVVIFILQFAACLSTKGFNHVGHRLGEDVTLSCFKPFDPEAAVCWSYRSDKNPKSVDVVRNGKVVDRSARTARLRVKSDGSLVITNVTAQDAGVYSCQFEGYINVFHISLDILPGVKTSKDTTPVGTTPESVTPTFKGNNLDVDVFEPWSPLSFIMLAFCIIALVLIVVLTIEIIRNKDSKKPLRDYTVRYVADDDTVNYENHEDAPAAAAIA